MRELIQEEITDMDGINCYITKGELIRCKDCKFYARNKNIFHRGSDCLKRIIDTIVPDVDFCSNAKRKEE